VRSVKSVYIVFVAFTSIFKANPFNAVNVNTNALHLRILVLSGNHQLSGYCAEVSINTIKITMN
jgi:hypothetical protein